MTDEFEKITKPVINYFWNSGYFTVPVPEKGMKEFKLDLPAFERFDIVAMKWDGQDVRIKAVESKFEAKKGISQARTYQLCIPDVYVAAKDEKLDKESFEKFDNYGIGYISVPKTKSTPSIKIESRTSRFFNRKYYNDEVFPRAFTFLAFYDFMLKSLQLTPEDAMKKLDYGAKVDCVWVSDRSSSKGIQWSIVYINNFFKFGINLESVKAIKNAFENKNRTEMKNVFTKIEKLPQNSIIRFERRCPEGERFKKGQKHESFKKFGVSEKRLSEMSHEDFKFIKKKVKEDKYIEFGIWMEICRLEELSSFTRYDFWKKMNEFKEEYLDDIYEDLKS